MRAFAENYIAKPAVSDSFLIEFNFSYAQLYAITNFNKASKV